MHGASAPACQVTCALRIPPAVGPRCRAARSPRRGNDMRCRRGEKEEPALPGEKQTGSRQTAPCDRPQAWMPSQQGTCPQQHDEVIATAQAAKSGHATNPTAAKTTAHPRIARTSGRSTLREIEFTRQRIPTSYDGVRKSEGLRRRPHDPRGSVTAEEPPIDEGALRVLVLRYGRPRMFDRRFYAHFENRELDEMFELFDPAATVRDHSHMGSWGGSRDELGASWWRAHARWPRPVIRIFRRRTRCGRGVRADCSGAPLTRGRPCSTEPPQRSTAQAPRLRSPACRFGRKRKRALWQMRARGWAL